MRTIRFAASLALVAVVLLFAVKNLRAVYVDAIFWKGELSLALVAIGAYVLGWLSLTPLFRLLRRTRRDRRDATQRDQDLAGGLSASGKS
jgi:uncharacterized integral membrane protein